MTFSIPQFGDFFHDMVIRTSLTAFQANAQLTPLQTVPQVVPAGRRRKRATKVGDQNTADATDLTPFPTNGYNPDGTTDNSYDGYPAADHYYNLVDAFGNRLVEGTGVVQSVFTPHAQVYYRNFVRYCEYPGNRLFDAVKFDVNGNPLDEYDYLVPVFLTKFCLPPNKVVGYSRLVGQEVPLQGYGGLQECPIFDPNTGVYGSPDTGISNNLALRSQGFALFNNPPPGAYAVPPVQGGGAPSDFQPSGAGTLTQGSETFTLSWPGGAGPTGLLPPYASWNTAQGVTFAALGSTPAPVVDFSRELKAIVDGPQTPKPAQPQLDIWNKLR